MTFQVVLYRQINTVNDVIISTIMVVVHSVKSEYEAQYRAIEQFDHNWKIYHAVKVR